MIKNIEGKIFSYEKSFTEKLNAKRYARQRRKIRNTRVIKKGNIWEIWTKKV